MTCINRFVITCTLAATALLAAGGCKSVAAKPLGFTPSKASPALLTASETGHMVLQQTLQQIFHGQLIAISKDALTKSHQLVIQRKTARDSNMQPVEGKIPGLKIPSRAFSLWKYKNQCFLYDEKFKKHYLLKNTSCH